MENLKSNVPDPTRSELIEFYAAKQNLLRGPEHFDQIPKNFEFLKDLKNSGKLWENEAADMIPLYIPEEVLADI